MLIDNLLITITVVVLLLLNVLVIALSTILIANLLHFAS